MSLAQLGKQRSLYPQDIVDGCIEKRKNGWSYDKIADLMNIPKSTIQSWFKKRGMTIKYKEK